MATSAELVESVKITALLLDRAVVALRNDPESNAKREKIYDLTSSIQEDLNGLELWVDGGCVEHPTTEA